MKSTVSEWDFITAFQGSYENNFSVSGRKALFAYLEEYEEDTGEEIELDVVALCCDFSEYENIDQAAADLGMDDILKDLREEHGEDNDEEIREAFLEELQDRTTVIDVDGEGLIVQAF